MSRIRGNCLIHGEASGPLLCSTVPLSFWGGTDPLNGEIIDRHHPLSGKCLRGRILAIPSGRGSCTGSMAMLELLLADTAPAGLVFEVPEQIVTLGVIVAQKLLGKTIPVVVLSSAEFASLQNHQYVAIVGVDVYAGALDTIPSLQTKSQQSGTTPSHVELSEGDKTLLSKGRQNAKGLAMEILVEFAKVPGASNLVNVSQVHIDCCVYTGQASLLFAESLLNLPEAKVAVPTSMNSLSIDQRRWKELGMEAEKSEAANRLGNAYVKMGARQTFTCAPYLLDSAPKNGQHVGWAESNAVVFANSVLGARTQKYPDLIDVCIALIGRAPSYGCHIQENRGPQLVLEVPPLPGYDESIYPLLGYCVGLLSSATIPVVVGMEEMLPSIPDLKAFGAAFATTSSAAMFHIRGVTPEALSADEDYPGVKRVKIRPQDLVRCWKDLNTAENESVSLVALGNPHFALEEFFSLAKLCEGHDQPTAVPLVITTSRAIHERFIRSGRDQVVEKVGAQIISDTCWCMLEEPVVTPGGGNIMTNSAKYAHYAPGLVKRNVHFNSLEKCVDAAFEGRHRLVVPSWLTAESQDDR